MINGIFWWHKLMGMNGIWMGHIMGEYNQQYGMTLGYTFLYT